MFIQLTHTGQALWRVLGQLKREINRFVGIEGGEEQFQRVWLCHLGQNPHSCRRKTNEQSSWVVRREIFCESFFLCQGMVPSASPRQAAAGVALVAFTDMQCPCSRMFAKPTVSSWLWGGHHLCRMLAAHLLLCAKYPLAGPDVKEDGRSRKQTVPKQWHCWWLEVTPSTAVLVCPLYLQLLDLGLWILPDSVFWVHGRRLSKINCLVPVLSDICDSHTYLLSSVSNFLCSSHWSFAQ